MGSTTRKNVKDHFPLICAAGRRIKSTEHIPDALKVYSLEDKIHALKYEAKIPDKPPLLRYKLPELENFRNWGIYTHIYHILHACPVETRYQTLVNDLKETTYSDYWTYPLGKKRDSTGLLPTKIDPYSTTFGVVTPKQIKAKDLINPDKTYGQVSEEFKKGHELYRKSHNDYFINEHKDRGYCKSNFNPNERFGGETGYDKRGIWVKSCLNIGDKNDLAVVNDVRANYAAKYAPKLGKVFMPNKNHECVPEQHAYGKVHTEIDISELFNENLPCAEQLELRLLVEHVNGLRKFMKNRYNQMQFDFTKFMAKLRYFDKNFDCWIPLDVVYKMCAYYDINFDHEKMTRFGRYFDIIKDDCIHYVKFVNLLNWKCKFPEITSKWYQPNYKLHYETSYNAAIDDHKLIDNDKLHPAGIPSVRNDIAVPVIPIGGCRADINHFGAETDAGTLIYPSVYTQYGLNFYDFLKPRPKEEIRSIFQNVGHELNDDEFEKLWQEALVLNTHCEVNVDNFKIVLRNFLKTRDKVEHKIF